MMPYAHIGKIFSAFSARPTVTFWAFCSLISIMSTSHSFIFVWSHPKERRPAALWLSKKRRPAGLRRPPAALQLSKKRCLLRFFGLWTLE